MSNTKRETSKECDCDACIYQAARAKDAELIQQLFDALYAEQFVPSLGPSPLTKPAISAAAPEGKPRTVALRDSAGLAWLRTQPVGCYIGNAASDFEAFK